MRVIFRFYSLKKSELTLFQSNFLWKMQKISQILLKLKGLQF